MTTRTSPLTSVSTRIAFASTCPKCGHHRLQHGYSRRILLSLIIRRSSIDAYCIECNVCWPIGETERRALAPLLNARLRKCNDGPSSWCRQRPAAHDPERATARRAPRRSAMTHDDP